MIKSKYNKDNRACEVEITSLSGIELTKELASVFETFSKHGETKMILLSVIDSYLGNELKGER
jgi:hypothetical protein